MKNKLVATAQKPARYFDFHTIAGNHRRIAAQQLLEHGYPQSNVPACMSNFATGLRDIMYGLDIVQARLMGALDNSRGSTKLEQQPIDVLFLAKTAIER
jgi:hypothetical protein